MWVGWSSCNPETFFWSYEWWMYYADKYIMGKRYIKTEWKGIKHLVKGTLNPFVVNNWWSLLTQHYSHVTLRFQFTLLEEGVSVRMCHTQPHSWDIYRHTWKFLIIDLECKINCNRNYKPRHNFLLDITSLLQLRDDLYSFSSHSFQFPTATLSVLLEMPWNIAGI